MKAEKFNSGWFVKEGVTEPFAVIFSAGEPLGTPVMLPQDAMILEERDENCPSKSQSGFYPAKSYTYTKEFEVPEEWSKKTTVIEFEGIMMSAMVYLNGKYLASHSYGYSGFYVDLTPYLNYGQKNTLKVVSVNKERASRWYSGSGIYRDVVLWQGGKQYIRDGAVRVTAEKAEEDLAVLSVQYEITNREYREAALTAVIEIIDENGEQVRRAGQSIAMEPDTESESFCRLTVREPKLWSVDTPYLYRIKITLSEGDKELDVASDSFGIRTLSLDSCTGLKINGKEVKLRGACIHHDNGIIGATTLEAAEEFRLRALKEAGFNSIRSAHNPASKAMLRVCDRIGMLVMDELSDMWNEQKNANDFSLDFQKIWQEEVQNFTAKDYNHPSVILYSTGNEIPEIGRSTGADMNRKLAKALRDADHTRYTTCCISGFLAVLDRLDDYAALMEQATKAVKENESQGDGGSEGLNHMMGSAEQQIMDSFSVSRVLNECLEPVESELDVIGYNYLTARHEYEHFIHPDRIIVGSETYPPEIPRLWEIVKKTPYVIGDFTWTGYDYIGEAGIGIFHYDTDRKEQGWFPDRLAYMGDIDLNGNRRDISYFREIVYGLRKKPYIAVERADKAGHSYDMNHWKFKNAIHSWTFPGFEGTEVKAFIFSGNEEVELFLNEKSLGKHRVGEQEPFTAIFQIPYETGTLRTVAYENGKAVAEDSISTATEAAGFHVELSKKELAAGGADVVFITVDLVDAKGRRNMSDDREVNISVEGAGTLAGFASANPIGGGSYQDTNAFTYDGRIMAAVRSTDEPGEIGIKVSARGCGEKEILINSVEQGF